MTPEERIQQLAAQRGGVATFPRPVRPAPHREPVAPAKPNGFGTVLPQIWKATPDNWGHREERERLKNLETWLAAGVIVRYLGKDWHKDRDEHGRILVIHRDGFGFHFRRDWQADGRFQSSPLETYRRNEPASITTSAERTLGAIARDIENRLVHNGLREAYEKSQSTDRHNREERRARFQAIEAIARSWNGRITPARRWQAQDYPEAEIPGGHARIGYGFADRGTIELSLTLDLPDATNLGQRR